jgi:DNA-binding PadR family transcriptional regulator
MNEALMTQDHPRSFLPLTPTAFHILVTLEGGVHHGYAIKRAVEERTGGVIRLGAGTLYHTIQSLERRVLIEECDPPSRDVAATSRWRFYRITDLGQRVLRAEVERLEADLGYARAQLNPSDG